MSARMIQAFWLDPRDKPALLIILMKALAGDAHIAFEGDLSDLDFSQIADATASLHRESPESETMVVLPLEIDTIKPILDQVLPEGRIVKKIVAIQIEKSGQVEFMAGDNFHRECVSVGPAVKQSLLQELVARGIIRSYEPGKPGSP
jgi:hypothetical protein